MNYIEHLIILASAGTGCVSISPFVSSVFVSIAVASSAVRSKTFSRIKKNRKKDNKIVPWAETKLNTIEVLTYKAWIGSYISQDEFALIDNVLTEHDGMTEAIKSLNSRRAHQRC